MDAACFCDESVPGLATGGDDGVVAVEDAACEEVLAEVLPDIFLGVEFRAVGRQRQQCDVVGHFESTPFLMPARTVDDNDGMGALRHFFGDFCQMKAHGLAIGAGHDQGRARVARGADRAEDIGIGMALVAFHARA